MTSTGWAGAQRTAEIPLVATAKAQAASQAGRIVFIDNVRWAMIVLVLGMHAAVTYSPVGSWYYREHPPLGAASTLFFVTFQGVLQGFFMALLFFIAGYFAASSYDAKGAPAFVRGRLFRLGWPTLLFVVAIGPLTEYFVAHSWVTRESFAHEMALYLIDGRFLGGTGPMWFCVALLIFTFAYVIIRVARPASPPATKSERPGLAGVVLTVAAMALATFLVRFAFPMGTAVFNLQLGYFPSYVILFSLGIVARRRGWLEATSARFASAIAAACVGLAMLIWLPLLVLGGALSGESGAFAGGPHWQSAVLSLWEALICVGMSFGVLAGFRAWLPDQGRFSKFMSDNAFAVYVLHPPILVAIAIALAPVALDPIAKFALVWALAAAACFGIAAPLARRAPLLGRIL